MSLKASLSPRQTAVLGRLALGDDRKTVAARLKIEVRTVRFHVENARRRLGAVSTMAALRIFILSQHRPKWGRR